MRANLSIFSSIKAPFWLFVGCFVLAFSTVMGRWLAITAENVQCLFPISLYDIKSEHEWVLTKGFYHMYQNGFSQGHLSYVGTLSRFTNGELTEPATPIQRSVWFNARLNDNLLSITATQHKRGPEDQSRDADVKNYVFPHMEKGDVSVIGLYLLNGRVLSSGTEGAARNICVK